MIDCLVVLVRKESLNRFNQRVISNSESQERLKISFKGPKATTKLLDVGQRWGTRLLYYRQEASVTRRPT